MKHEPKADKVYKDLSDFANTNLIHDYTTAEIVRGAAYFFLTLCRQRLTIYEALYELRLIWCMYLKSNHYEEPLDPDDIKRLAAKVTQTRRASIQ